MVELMVDEWVALTAVKMAHVRVGLMVVEMASMTVAQTASDLVLRKAD